MRKWTYLVAMLMLACATTTFTGCIDTDEPAGIEQLRGAKAELLKAKAKVEEAKVKQVEAEAALKNAEAKAKEAEAQATLLRAEYEKAIAEQKAAAEIAKIEEQIANLKAQTDLLIAQAESERQSAAAAEREALIRLAQAQAELVQSQQEALQPYITAYENAVGDYNQEYKDYTTALKAYNEALTNLETNTNAEIEAKYDLEVAVEDAKANLAAAELAIEEITAALEEAEAMTPDELPTMRDAYYAEYESYNDSLVLLQLELDKLPINNPEFKKLQELKKAATEASTYTIAEYKNETAKGNVALDSVMAEQGLTAAQGYENGVFSYKKNEAASLKYNADEELVSDSVEYAIVEGWLEALETAYADENKHINDSINNTTNVWAKAVAEKDSLHQLAVAAWEILVDARYGNLTTATAAIDTLKKYTDAYNATFAKLAPAVATYNTAIDALKAVEDTVAVIAYNKFIADSIASQKEIEYVNAFNSWGTDSIAKVLGTNQSAWNALNPQTKEALDMFLSLVKKEALKTKIAAKADTLYTNWTKAKINGKTNYELLVEAATEAKAAAISKDLADTKKGKINPALKAVTGAWAKVDSIGNTALAANWSKVADVYGKFEATLNNDYGQVLSTKQTETSLKVDYTDPWKNVYTDKVAPLTDTLKVYISATDVNENVKFYYMAADGSDIDATEFGKMIASKLDETTVNTAWAKKSEAAWGYADRMLPVEEDAEDTNIGGTLKDLMDAKAKLAEYQAGMGIYETLATLIEEITAQKAVLDAQVAEAVETLSDKDAAVQEQKAVVKALKQEIKQAMKEIKAKQDIAHDFYVAYNTACDDFTGDLYTQDDIDFLVEFLEGLLEFVNDPARLKKLELAVLTAEEALANWDSVEQGEVKAAEATLANAKYDMEQAQAKMERTEAALKAALEALNKTTSAE